MKVTGAYPVAVPQERAYALLQDPAILAKCMPGCEGLDRVAENEYAMRMKMVLASISGQFAGKVKITEANPPTSFRLLVEGSGKIGFMKGEGLLTLSPSGGGTSVHFDGDVQVGGTIASVGQRLLDTTARMLIKKFFDKLAVEAGTAEQRRLAAD
ncbi:MAG TPA: carbon monoxide dehydrogenase subunit G [Bryobacteraceae bacterium]|jgi:carbon monoxide dehydrogenase subunit G|nr:carbon monoxide dehydrogenase subunit G [Bryobacteraceae bacterium]